MRASLPIDPVLPDVVAALQRHPACVLQAPTGAGKTTRVPPALLDSLPGLAGQILLLEPRRLAARAAARRMADERGGRLGDEIGYHVRFDRRTGPHTRIVAVTPGILLQHLHNDPFLEGTDVVLFDEFHERSLENDLALGMVRLLQSTVRPELRLVAMSATLATEPLARYLGDCPVVTSEGRLFPVDIRHEPRGESQPWPVATARAVERLLEDTPGDLLVFLPGLHEIRQTAKQLEAAARSRDLAVLPLHGDLPPEQQDAALLPLDRRKVVLATNVAETSVTVEGVTGVVDTGLARTLAFDPSLGLDRLRVTPISRASADQRAGRAGRLQPGVCVRLWSASAHRGRPEQTEPEIRRVDLAGAILHLLCLGEADVAHFPWLEPPPEATVAHALDLLRRLGAADGGVTSLGRTISRLPVHPRVGRLLVEGQRLGHPDRVALAAALLAEREPFTRTVGPRRPRSEGATVSDVLDRVEALEEFEQHGRLDGPAGILHRGGARFVLHSRDQLARSLRHATKEVSTDAEPDADVAVLRSLLAAFPDRVARRREAGSRRGRMVGGRGVRLDESSGVTASELFLCIDTDAGQGEALVRLASAVERDWLPADRLSRGVEIAFDPREERVTAFRRMRYEDLVLEEVPAPFPDNDRADRVLAEAAAAAFDRVRPADDSTAARFRTRVRCLHAWMPSLGLPTLDDDELRDLLPWVCAGRKSFAAVREGPWLEAMQSKLTPRQLQTLEREAPERIEVPSGSKHTLHYEEGRPPVLAVRIQEMFGLQDTPRVAAGRVRVLLHLLAPNHRPQQVTDDLASFWDNTYAQVRKDLRARYPKHAWPEDPRAAPPQRRPQRRRPGE